LGIVLLSTLLSACLPPKPPRIVKIGLVAPFEGRYRYVGYDAIYAARLAVREINAAGGVAGWMLELTAYDDRADPDMARTAARNLITDPDVVAVIGHYRQASTLAARALYTEAQMPLLVVGTWLTPTAAPVWFILPTPEQAAAAMLSAVPLADATAGTWGDGALAVALNDALRKHNDRMIPSASTFPDVVFSTLPPVEAASRLVAWRAAGWDGTLIGDIDLAAPEFAVVAGDAGEGALFVTPYRLPQDDLALEAWRVAYRAVGPHVPEPGVYARATYDAVYALAEAIAAAALTDGQPSRSGIQAALPNVRHAGASGTVVWDETGYWRDGPLYVYVWEQARARLVDSRR